VAGLSRRLIARAYGLDPKADAGAINASTGRNSTTERKIPQQVLTGAFASGFRLAPDVKDVGIAYRLAREPRDRCALSARSAEALLSATRSATCRRTPTTPGLRVLKRRSAPAAPKACPSRRRAATGADRVRSQRRST